MCLRQFRQPSCRRFLQHEVELVGSVAVHEENPVVLGKRRVHPQAVAHHVCFWDRLQWTARTDENIARHNQRVQRFWSLTHDSLVKWQLQVQQSLVNSLSPYPSEHRNGNGCLSACCVGRQTARLSSSMHKDAFFLRKPCVKRRGMFMGGSLFQQPCGATAAAQLVPYGVGRAEILLFRQVMDVQILPDSIRWQRQQFLHDAVIFLPSHFMYFPSSPSLLPAPPSLPAHISYSKTR